MKIAGSTTTPQLTMPQVFNRMALKRIKRTGTGRDLDELGKDYVDILTPDEYLELPFINTKLARVVERNSINRQPKVCVKF